MAKNEAVEKVSVDALESRVSELESDLRELALLLGSTFGEPIKQRALDIVEKHANR